MIAGCTVESVEPYTAFLFRFVRNGEIYRAIMNFTEQKVLRIQILICGFDLSVYDTKYNVKQCTTLMSTQVLINKNFQRKIVNIFLPIF